MTIGGDTEDENYLLNKPVKMCVDNKENIFVLDYGESHIKKFDTNGKHIKTFSGPGKGPGEIERCTGMAMHPEGQIVTWDHGNRRFSFFDNDGIFLESKQTNELIMFPDILWTFKIGPMGHIYVETHAIDLKRTGKGNLIKIWRFSPDFEAHHIVDSVRINDNEIILKEGSAINVPVPYHPNLFWELTPDGKIILCYSENYLIKIISPEMETLKTVHHPHKKLKVTNADKKLYFANLDSMESSGRVPKAYVDEVRKLTKFPKYKPNFNYLSIDHEGNILLQTNKKKKDNYYYDVFTAEGKFVAEVEMPVIGWSEKFINGNLYQLSQTDDGFPVVKRCKIE